MVKMIIWVVAYLILAPFVGGLLSGIDRIITARMQGRKGPSVLQPFYDVLKLTEKEKITVNNVQDFYVVCFFIFILVTGCMFFAGQDLLLVIFTLSLASTFLIIGAFSSGSAYSTMAAERELLQMMAYEPMVLIAAVAFYLHCGSFKVADIVANDSMGFPYMVAAFIGFVTITDSSLHP